MPGKNNVSTYRPRIFDSTLPHKSPTSSEDPSTSGLSFKSDRSKENIIYFKEGSSTLMADCSHSSEEEEGAADDDDDDDVQSSDRLPELQRPESAGSRSKRSTDNLRSNDKCDIPQSPTSSGYSSASGLSCKSDGSKDNTIIDFKGRSSTLMAYYSFSSEEEEGAAVDDDDDDVQPSDRLFAMSQREEAEEEGVRPTEPPLCGQPESQTGAQSPEQQRPESAGLKMDVEDNVSTESLPQLCSVDTVWRPPYPFDPNADEESTDDVISPPDLKGSLPELEEPEFPIFRMAGKRKRSTDGLSIRDRIRLLKSPTSSEYSSTSGLSFKSDQSKDNIIDFKERRSILIPELQRPESAGRRMAGKKIWSTDRHRLHDRIRPHKKRLKRRSMGPIPDFIEHSIHSPEQQRPESAGRRMAGMRNRSTFSRRLFAIHSLLELLLKQTMSLIHDFKERSNRSPELQRPESAGLKMTVEDIWSTFWHRFLPIHSLPKSPTSSEDSFTSSQSFKSDESKDNTIIDFKEGCSTLIPELQRPESAGLRMNEWRTRSTDRLLSRRQSRTSSRYSSTSKLYFKSDGSKDDSMVFRGRRSSLRIRTRQMRGERSKENTEDF